MNIVLCGMMGVGKSSVGIKIAELTGRRHLDTDIVIANRHGSISDIFGHHGEQYFRILETDVVKEFAKEDGLVISTGGGLVLKAENVALLKRNGKIFFLRASIKTLLERVKADETRPLLKDVRSAAERLDELLLLRAPVYSHVADYIIDTNGISIDEVAAQVIALMREEMK